MSNHEIETKVPAGPIEADPIPFYTGRDIPTEIQPLLREALEGIELGAYDERLIKWASFAWDQPTMVTICSWIMRARAKGPRR